MSEAWERSLERIRQGEEAERERRHPKSTPEEVLDALRDTLIAGVDSMMEGLQSIYDEMERLGFFQTEEDLQKGYDEDLNDPWEEEADVFV